MTTIRWTTTVQETYDIKLTGADLAEYQRLLAEEGDVDVFLADREDKSTLGEIEVTDRQVEG